MALPGVTLVEPLCVDCVEPVHPTRHVRDGRLEDEVVVRRHQAVGDDFPVEARCRVGEEGHECAAIMIVVHDRRVVDAERRDVEQAVREVSSKTPCDASTVTARRGRCPRAATSSRFCYTQRVCFRGPAGSDPGAALELTRRDATWQQRPRRRTQLRTARLPRPRPTSSAKRSARPRRSRRPQKRAPAGT